MISKLRWTALVMGLIVPLHYVSAVEPGERVPAFSASSISGAETYSDQDLQGKVILLDFWASWCGPCLQSMPVFNKLQNDYAAYGFEVVAINVDENIVDAKRFLEKTDVNFTVLADDSGKTPASFQIQTMPSSFLIDPSGVVRYAHQGFRKGDESLLRKNIENLLEIKNAQR